VQAVLLQWMGDAGGIARTGFGFGPVKGRRRRHWRRRRCVRKAIGGGGGCVNGGSFGFIERGGEVGFLACNLS